MIGKLPDDVLDIFMETIPIEFSVVDKDDKVLAWNKHETRIFKRPESVVGRDVRNCHPKKSVHLVERIIEDMKAGKRDSARFWIDLPLGPDGEKQKVLIEYYALRDREGRHLGIIEASRNISDIQALKGEKRLLDVVGR